MPREYRWRHWKHDAYIRFPRTVTMELVPGNSLICATPEEGRQLAVQLALKTSLAVQPDHNVQEMIRSAYANEADALIASAHVVAIEFATIAAANNYCR